MIPALVFGIWLSLLAVATLAISRELGLLRAEGAGIFARVQEGPPIGSFVRGIEKRARTYLFLDCDCSPCADLLEKIEQPILDLVVVLRGDAADLTPLAQSHLTSASIVGIEAGAMFERLGIRATPFALRAVDGIVVGKALPSAPGDLLFSGRPGGLG